MCDFIYEEADGRPEDGIAAGTRWTDVSHNWACPECGLVKSDFVMVEIYPRGAVGATVATDAHPLIFVGAGLIGCEFANDLVAAGHRVSVMDPSNGPLATLLPAEASARLQHVLTGLGVAWHWGTTVHAVHSVTMAEGVGQMPAPSLELSNGLNVSADIVLSAIGLKADLALAASLTCERGFVLT